MRDRSGKKLLHCAQGVWEHKCSTKTFCDIDHVILFFIYIYRLSDVLVYIETQDVLWISNHTFEHAFSSKYLDILKFMLIFHFSFLLKLLC